MNANEVKQGRKVTTVTNGFTGEIRVCEIEEVHQEDLDAGFVFICYPDNLLKGRRHSVYVSIHSCVPYNGEEPVGTLIEKRKATRRI